MCGILAAVSDSLPNANLVNVARACAERGRDAYGSFSSGANGAYSLYKAPGKSFFDGNHGGDTLFNINVGNVKLAAFRAEPTTEHVESPKEDDVQPYICGDWVVVHNGTISNDKEIYEKFGLAAPTHVDSYAIVALLDYFDRKNMPTVLAWEQMQREIKGSWAMCGYHRREPGRVHFATSYRPLYVSTDFVEQLGGHKATILSSVPLNDSYKLVKPYSSGYATGSQYRLKPMRQGEEILRERSLVVLSGGLDSTTVAAMLKKQGHEVQLVHFRYGCRASASEMAAVVSISKRLELPLRVIDLDIFETIGGSTLLQPGSEIADGITGAEAAIEYVPARNTIMASIVIALAERHGFNNVALGINLEEAGSYPDNCLELYESFNKMMHWVLKPGSNVKFISPIGHLMKHEVVRAGIEAGAPYDVTWSCYNDGEKHCGNCGPCFMRRKAFEINGLVDPVGFVAQEVTE